MKNCQIKDENNEVRPCAEQINNLGMILNSLPSVDEFQTMANVFKAISDPTRLKILHLLAEGELCVCEIIYVLEKPQSTISHHLNILKNAGFIKWRKEGVWIHYRLSDDKLIEEINVMIETVQG
ncbi:ArsR/SmtB family transcription factor [Methanobacterium aggregans]|uniref:ArsR/SmtB family transcription factor n=1 Tax=Methanobacterium aggregans TaxID=1615586 RepID=UPI00320C6E53